MPRKRRNSRIQNSRFPQVSSIHLSSLFLHQENIMAGALRLGDNHICPKAEGTKPHIGGPGGMPTPPAVKDVLINGRLALTKGDSAFCIGPPDKITQGIEGVTIGGCLAADSAASTEHGGKFILCSSDVIIG
jgi:uncharacterized Zn-binding protein involved in type VI secretion